MEYLYTTLTISMITPSTFTAVTSTPSSTIVNQQTSYGFSFTFSQQHYSGDKILLTFPTSLSVNSGFQCNSNTAGVTISCFQSTPSNVIVVTLTSSNTISNSLSFNVTNIRNAWYAQTVSFAYDSTTNDTTYYYVEKGTSVAVLERTSLATTHNPNNQLTLL